jgi:hypothetical protein
MLWGILICLALLSLIYVAFRRLPFFKDAGLSASSLSLAFVLKLVGALAIFLIYSFHYQDRASSDIFKYYDDAVVIYSHPDWQISEVVDLFKAEHERSPQLRSILENTQHWDQEWKILPNDNRLMILLNLLLLYISQDFYFFHLLSFTFLAFIGIWALCRFFSELLPIGPKPLLALLVLPPSTLLWTSGILKESLFFFTFGLLLYTLSRLKSRKSGELFLLAVLLFALSIWLKAYLFISFLPALLLFLLKDTLRLKYNLLIIALAILGVFLIFWSQIETGLNAQLQRFTELAIDIQANTYFNIEARLSLLDFLKGVPQAIYNAWIRPIFMWDRGIFSLINALESLFYLFLPLLLIRFRRKGRPQWLLFWMLISFLFIGSVIIGSSIPVMGAVLRYRSPLIPFYLILLFTFVDINQLKQIFNK